MHFKNTNSDNNYCYSDVHDVDDDDDDDAAAAAADDDDDD